MRRGSSLFLIIAKRAGRNPRPFCVIICMDRRKSFVSVAVAASVFFFGACKRVWGEVSRYRWPSYPSEKALRKHVAYDKNHKEISPEEVSAMSFQDLIDAHDKSHDRHPRFNKAPYPNGKQVPNTKKGRGETKKKFRLFRRKRVDKGK